MENQKEKRIVFMGTPEFSVPVLEGLIKDYNVVGIVTQPDKETGRHREMKPSPIKEVGLKYGIKVLQPNKIRTDYQEVLDLKPDLIITCAFGQIVPKVLLDFPEYGCINVHASLLPRWRGAAPMQRALMAGDKKTGITIMYMDEQLDTGDIICQKELEITENMNLGELHDLLSDLGKEVLLQVLPSIFEKTNQRIKQPEEGATYANRILKENEYLDLSKTPEELKNWVRALNPFPGATLSFDGKVMKVYEIEAHSCQHTNPYGKITDVLKDGIKVAVRDGEIILKEIKPEGKKRLLVKDYLNGVDKESLKKKSFGGLCE